MPNQRRNPSGPDPRLQQVAELVRFERRGVLYVGLYLAAILSLFAWIAFIPGPLHALAEDLCLRVLGHIDSTLLAYGALLFLFLIQAPVLGAIAISVRLRPPADPQRYDRLESVRKQLLVEGFTPHELGIWTKADWCRCLRRMGILCALLTCLVCAVLYGINRRLAAHTRPIRNVRLEGNDRLDGGPVRIIATARLDLAFRTSKESYGAGKNSGESRNIFRLDRRYGFQPTVRGSSYRDTLFVPLIGSAWRPDQPIEVFYQCDRSCVFDVPKGSSLEPVDVIVSGRLHRSALPLFVKRTFERAGIAVASPYYVLTDREPDPADRVARTWLVGLLLTVCLFGLSALYGLADQSRAKSIIQSSL